MKSAAKRIVILLLAAILVFAGTADILATDVGLPASAVAVPENNEGEPQGEEGEQEGGEDIPEETCAETVYYEELPASEDPAAEEQSIDGFGTAGGPEAPVTDTDPEAAQEPEAPQEPEDVLPVDSDPGSETAGDSDLPEDALPVGSEPETLKGTPDGEPGKAESQTPGGRELIFEGEDYSCTVTVTGRLEDIEGYSLEVTEVPGNTDEFEEYISRTEDALNGGAIHRARFFDISILGKDSMPVQPAEGELVSVNITIDDFETEDASVVHFGDETEVLDIRTDGDAISFETGGFSVYAIVTLDDKPEGYEWTRITSLEELEAQMESGVYISHVDGYYLTSVTNKITTVRTGIKKTEPAAESPDSAAGAVKYYFVKSGDRYYVYCYSAQHEQKFVQMTGNSLYFTPSIDTATAFTIEKFPGYNDVFRLSAAYNGTDYCWNMRGGANGHEIATYTNMTDTNARFKFEYTDEDDDPYGLHGRELRIVYVKEDVKSIALSNGTIAPAGTAKGRITAETLLTRRDIINGEGVLIVASETDVPKYRFENIGGDAYLVSTIVGGTRKYLSLSSSGAALVSSPEGSDTRIYVTEGTGTNKGKYVLTSESGYTLTQQGENAANGFSASASVTSLGYLNFAEELPELEPGDFVSYIAKKVSVSDTVNVHDQSKVVVYTRIWNEDTLKYEYYIIDYNGRLIKATESGDEIHWINGQVNTVMWNFTDYQNADGSPNYYYELTNEYSGVSIAPQLDGNQILSDAPIGINMTGRRYGENYTTLLAWDDTYYDYAGLKVEDGRLVPCPMAQAIPFYFAVLSEDYTPEGLTVVPTIDNDEYGISMKMIDFNGAMTNSRNKQQTDLLGWDTNGKGLVLPYLNDRGYPATDPAVTGQPAGTLEDLFGDATYANHLFSEKTYNENGYFEYDSTQNSAYIGDGTDFTVYNQLVTMPGGSQSLNHGQFMPYNSIINPDTGEPWPFSTTHFNTNSTTNEELPDSNPRKGESLYEIPKKDTSNSYPGTNVSQPYKYADYFFGMQMEASFTQTPDGLDKWDHDIIFEFSGDDDMWLFVDGGLIMDIGGVHSASTGTVNFRTGEVSLIVKNAQNKVLPERTETTDLRTLFEASYRAEHPSAADAEVETFLDEYFKPGTSVFKDYSKHDMKMFYMERGASASNLKLKFNLTSVQPGHLLLEKNVTGTTSQDYNLAEFPFQVFYHTEEFPGYLPLTPDTEEAVIVYKDTTIPVTFRPKFTPAGSGTSYSNVFMLKSGQVADILLPPDTLTYYVTECGVNDSIYDEVLINGEPAQATASGSRSDYSTGENSIDEVPQVVYDNHVNPNALRTLTITKKLFAEDGITPLTREDDSTPFNFRIYLCDENQSAFTAANMTPYHVRDEAGNYCRWDPLLQTFSSLGKTSYEDLTGDEKISATFVTSPNGSVSKIPAGYSVEMREIPIGTKFRVIERDNEIPSGYALMDNGYVRVQGTYIVEDGDLPNEGKIRDNSDPVIEVYNKRIWELNLNKVWSDRDYVYSHEDIFFAVYCDGELVDGTVKVLRSGGTSLKYRFDTLLPGKTFGDYEVKEVSLSGAYIIADDGTVTGYDTVTPAGDTAVIDAVRSEGAQPEPYTYSITYAQGQMEGVNNNLRTDTVTNTRAGLKVIKKNTDGDGLGGAVFTLSDSNGDPVGASSYTSASDGFVTIAYLDDGEYTLTETHTPAGYMSLAGSFTITKNGNDYVISNADALAYSYDASGEMPVLTIYNEPRSISLLKLDGDTGLPLEGVHFSLHRQVMGTGGPRKDYRPVTGYADMVTDAQGLFPVNLGILPAGTYYLAETRALAGYALPDSDVCFTISDTGAVTLENGSGGSLAVDDDGSLAAYTVTVTNASPAGDLSVTKMVAGSIGDKQKEFSFTITFSADRVLLPDYLEYEGPDGSGTVILDNGTAGFTLAHGETITFLEVPVGVEYEIAEEDYSPDGYRMTSDKDLAGTITAAGTAITVTNTKNGAIPTDVYDRGILVSVLLLIGAAICGILYKKMSAALK